jgi:hypothetical protein
MECLSASRERDGSGTARHKNCKQAKNRCENQDIGSDMLYMEAKLNHVSVGLVRLAPAVGCRLSSPPVDDSHPLVLVLNTINILYTQYWTPDTYHSGALYLIALSTHLRATTSFMFLGRNTDAPQCLARVTNLPSPQHHGLIVWNSTNPADERGPSWTLLS